MISQTGFNRYLSATILILVLMAGGLSHNNSLLKAAPLTTVTVLPSGDTSGVTDWANLNAAFEDANALTGFGPGTTVKLASGTFYIEKPLLVSNFSGKLKGAGRVMDVGPSGTTITNGAVPFPLGDFGDNQIPKFPTFITFYLDNNWDPNQTADIEVSHLTTHWSGVTELWALEFDSLVEQGLLGFFWVPGRLTGTKDSSELSLVNTTWHHLEMTADAPVLPETAISIFNLVTDLLPDDNGDGFQANGWEDIKPIQGDQEVANVYIENINFPLFMTGVDDSEVLVDRVIVNNPATVDRCCRPAVVFCDSSNTAFTVTHLETTNAQGVAFPQGHWRDISQITASTYLLSRSTIQRQGGFSNIVLRDNVNRMTGIPTIKAKLEQNTLIGTPFTPIFSRSVDDLIVTKNIISGSGFSAILAFGGKDGVIHDNQVSAFNPAFADILLDSTSGFIVFGNDPADTVIDLVGTDNIIVNANGIPKSALDNETEQEMKKRLRQFKK